MHLQGGEDTEGVQFVIELLVASIPVGGRRLNNKRGNKNEGSIFHDG
jgi:hypothetical protein